MNILKSIIFGIIEGITEWLPVSSTGHMILLNQFLPLDVSPEFYSLYEVVIQLGAVMAVVVLYWSKLWPFGRKNNRAPLAAEGPGSYVKTDKIFLWLRILVSCIPAVIVGLLFDDFFEAHFYNYIVVATMLILFGIAFIYIEFQRAGKRPTIRKISEIDYKTALLIGLFQVIAAVFPGTSRSGATIVGALLLGVSRTAAAEYTFYLAVPVMIGASLLKIIKLGLAFSFGEYMTLLVGMIVAFVVSVAVIRFMMDYIRKNNFVLFGWYRIILGAMILVAGIAGIL